MSLFLHAFSQTGKPVACPCFIAVVPTTLAGAMLHFNAGKIRCSFLLHHAGAAAVLGHTSVHRNERIQRHYSPEHMMVVLSTTNAFPETWNAVQSGTTT